MDILKLVGEVCPIRKYQISLLFEKLDLIEGKRL